LIASSKDNSKIGIREASKNNKVPVVLEQNLKHKNKNKSYKHFLKYVRE
jgi:hypothetical protein